MAYYDCIAHGEDVDATCSECYAELESELARLREEVEKWKVCHRGAWEENETLAAENAGLRESLAYLYGTYCEPGDFGYPNGDPGGDCARAGAALASPSPLTAAVGRVLVAVGRMKERTTLERSPSWEEVARDVDHVLDTYDALRALLEGREPQ